MKKGEGRKTCNKSTKTCAGLSCRKYKMMLREPTSQKMVFQLESLLETQKCDPPVLESPTLHLGARALVSSQYADDGHVHPQAKLYWLEFDGWHFKRAGIGEGPGYPEDPGGTPLTPHLWGASPLLVLTCHP